MITQQTDVIEFTKKDDNTETRDIFISVTNMEGKTYTDQTRRFSTTSSQGNKYIMIAYDYDSNSINAECLKSRSGKIVQSHGHEVLLGYR